MNKTVTQFINEVCKMLGIEKPIISTDTSNFQSSTMMAQAHSSGNSIHIKDTDKPTPDYLFAIVHELRHIWQMRTTPDVYFTGYKTANEISIEDYNNQLAEIDANAFGAVVMMDAFGIKPMFQGLPKDTIDRIWKRVEEIKP